MIGPLLRPDGLPNIPFVPVELVDKFIMGKGDSGNYRKHFSFVPHKFEIAKTLITNSQFQVFIDDNNEGYDDEKWWNFSEDAQKWKQKNRYPTEQSHPEKNHPRVNITWFEAIAFCRWLSSKLNNWFRLPTEAEWELVARGTDGRLYPWGDEVSLKRSNTKESNINATCPIGIYNTSDYPYPYVYDLIGNVFEWNLTRWESSYPFNWKDYRNNIDGSHPRVIRGGSFRYSIHDIDSTTRIALSPSRHMDDVGFRIVQVKPNDKFLHK